MDSARVNLGGLICGLLLLLFAAFYAGWLIWDKHFRSVGRHANPSQFTSWATLKKTVAERSRAERKEKRSIRSAVIRPRRSVETDTAPLPRVDASPEIPREVRRAPVDPSFLDDVTRPDLPVVDAEPPTRPSYELPPDSWASSTGQLPEEPPPRLDHIPSPRRTTSQEQRHARIGA